MQLHNRIDLKIFYCGCLLDGPQDPAIDCLPDFLNHKTIGYLAENPTKLANEIPFCTQLKYWTIEHVAPDLAVNFVKRLTALRMIAVFSPIRDIERFLNLLKNFPQILHLVFYDDQPQELFDRLPDYCAVQTLEVNCPVTNLQFLTRLKFLVDFETIWSIDKELVRKVLEELEFLSWLEFWHPDKVVVKVSGYRPKQYAIWFDRKWRNVADLNDAIQFIVEVVAKELYDE